MAAVVADDDCICRGCRLRREAGDVAARCWNLPHQDLSEMVILRHIGVSAFLDLDGAPASPAAEPEPSASDCAGWLTESGWAAVRT